MASSSYKRSHVRRCWQRLLDASVPLPQELVQAQKGGAKHAQQTPPPPWQRNNVAAAPDDVGAGQLASGPAKAAKGRRRTAMHKDGELPLAHAGPVTAGHL